MNPAVLALLLLPQASFATKSKPASPSLTCVPLPVSSWPAHGVRLPQNLRRPGREAPSRITSPRGWASGANIRDLGSGARRMGLLWSSGTHREHSRSVCPALPLASGPYPQISSPSPLPPPPRWQQVVYSTFCLQPHPLLTWTHLSPWPRALHLHFPGSHSCSDPLGLRT